MESNRQFTDNQLEILLDNAIKLDSCSELYNSLLQEDKDMLVLIGLISSNIHIANKVMYLDSERLKEQINNPLIDLYRLIIRYSDNLTLLVLISLMSDTTIERIYDKMINSARLSNLPYRIEVVKLYLRQRKGKE